MLWGGGEVMIKNILENLIEVVCLQRKKVEEDLKYLPEGSLIVRSKNNRKYYSIYLSGKEKGITNNKELVAKLIKKSNALNDLHYLNSVDAALNFALSKIPAKNYKFPNSEEWESANFETNPYKPDNLKYKTNHGEFVRSKSEKIIADALHSMSIPFRYEAVFLVDNQTFYPDFHLGASWVDGKTRLLC